MESVREVLENMNKIIDDPHNMPETTDKVINDIMESGISYSFDTPASSVNGSLKGSRCGSLRSISSLVNSRSNSPLCISENNHLRKDKSGSIRSYTNSPRNRFSHISLSGQTNLKSDENKTAFTTSFYSQDDSTDLSNNPHSSVAARRSRPNSTCEMYGGVREASCSPSRHIRDDNQTFSTIRRTQSPLRKPAVVESIVDKGSKMSMARRLPLPRKYQPADRPPIPPRSDSVDRINNFALQGDTACGKVMQVEEESAARVITVATTPKCLQRETTA